MPVNMKSKGKTAERHAEKYFSVLPSKYTFAHKKHTIPYNEILTINVKPFTIEDEWFVTVNYNNEVHTIKISWLYKPTQRNMLKAEDYQIKNLEESLRKLTANGTQNINISISNTVYNVAKVERVNGFKKADLCLTAANNMPVVYVSLKKGAKPKDSFGFGGLGSYKNHPVLQDFLKAINWIEHPAATSYARKLDVQNNVHIDLMMRLMYGNDYEANSNPNSVDYIMFGNTVAINNSNGNFLVSEKILPKNTPYDGTLQVQTIYCTDRKDLGLQNTLAQLRQEGSRKVTHYV